MARLIKLPRNPGVSPGTHHDQTVGEWLVREMRERNISNNGLFAQMQCLGFRAISSNIVSLWRGDASAISPHTLPMVLQALGMDVQEQRLWARHFVYAEMPELWPLLEEAP